MPADVLDYLHDQLQDNHTLWHRKDGRWNVDNNGDTASITTRATAIATLVAAKVVT